MYPRTFAKVIVKGILRTKEGPIPVPTYTVHEDEPPAKRARTDNSPENPKNPWDEVFTKLRNSLPKSGIQTWTNPFHEVFKEIQALVPQERIGVIKAGKGLERYIPGETVWSQEFPMRHTIVLHRVARQIEDLGIENWSNLSKMQQHRRAKPSHIMLCLFSERPREVAPESNHDQIEESDVPMPASENVSSNQPDQDQAVVTPCRVDVPSWTPMSATVSGPKFLALSDKDKGIIRKLHRNLGHPTAARLARHLTEMHALPQLVEGAKDFQCESCAELTGPQKSTPGNLKDPKDFNEKISIDGFEWKSKSGLTTYVLHILDDATRFHLGRRTQRDSQLLTKGLGICGYNGLEHQAK
jgi:hypothetical protein